MDLEERFDRALEGGPAHRPVEDRLLDLDTLTDPPDRQRSPASTMR